MSRHRFFLQAPLPEAVDGAVVLPLTAADVHHAVGVLRVRTGEEIDVVEPGGAVARVAVTAATSEAVLATIVDRRSAVPAVASPRVTLVFGVSKGGRNDEIVEGATEVGVAAFLPVLTSRSIVKLDADKRAERGARWRRVALAAAKQSKRDVVPEVAAPADLADVLPVIAGFDLVLIAWEETATGGIGVREAIARAVADLGRAARVAICVGPEGGLAGEEVAALERIGATPVTLGATILRAETAAVVASALVVHELGGLGNAS